MIFLAGSAASGKTKKAVAYGWKERKTSEDGVLLFSLQHERRRCGRFCRACTGRRSFPR